MNYKLGVILVERNPEEAVKITVNALLCRMELAAQDGLA